MNRAATKLACLALALAALLVGCGGGGGETETTGKSPSELDDLYISLDGYSGAENVGVLMARKMGYFEEVGLRVTATTPATHYGPVFYTTTESVDLAVSHLPQVAIEKQNGAPIVAIGSLIAEPTAALIWLPGSGIEDVADLKGKTIAIPGLSFQEKLLEGVLERAGVAPGEVTVEKVDYDLAHDLIEGEFDAIFGSTWNIEGVELETRGLDPVVTRVQDLGVPDYEELVVIANRDRLEEDPRSVRDFMSAVERGTEAAIDDADGALEAIEESAVVDLRLTPKIVEAQLEASLPLLSETGEMDPEQAEDFTRWMQEEEMIRRVPPVASLLTNRYLPDS